MTTGTVRTILLTALAALLLGGCSLWGQVDQPYVTQTINASGAGTYNLQTLAAPITVQGGGGSVTITAPASNTGDPGRGIFEDGTTPESVDQQSCATWSENSWSGNQDGLALRASDAHALIVTDNVFPYGASANFNFYTWSPDAGAQWLSSLDLNAQVGVPMPFPLHVCTQVVGSAWSIKAWTDSQPEPPDWTPGPTVPDAWNVAGRPCWYVGHIDPGQHMTITGMTTTNLDTTGATQ